MIKVALSASDASEFLCKNLDEINSEWKNKEIKEKALDQIPSETLILNSSGIILYSHRLKNEKLFFTKLKYDDNRYLREVKHFYTGDFFNLQKDCFHILKKLGIASGDLAEVVALDEQIGVSWIKQNRRLVFRFYRNELNRKGVVSLIVTKLDSEEADTKPLLNKEHISRHDKPVRQSLPKKETPAPSQISILTEKSHESKEENLDSKSEETAKIEKIELKVGMILTVSGTTSLRTEGMDGASILARVSPGDSITILNSEFNYFWTLVRVRKLEGWVKTGLIISK